jgi:hypothetical protein
MRRQGRGSAILLRQFASDAAAPLAPYHLRRPLKIKNEAGRQLLTDPLFNKGTAFTPGERDRLGIRGLLPPRELTMAQQAQAVMETLAKEDTPMRKVRAKRDRKKVVRQPV